MKLLVTLNVDFENGGEVGPLLQYLYGAIESSMPQQLASFQYGRVTINVHDIQDHPDNSPPDILTGMYPNDSVQSNFEYQTDKGGIRMTYRDLLAQLQKLTPEQLDMEAVERQDFGEYIPLGTLEIFFIANRIDEWHESSYLMEDQQPFFDTN